MAAASSTNMRQMRYEICVTSFDPIVYSDEVSSALCVPQPPEIPTKRFLAELAIKYEGRLMAEREWTCWNCPRKATCMVHTPCSYLHLPEPMVVDFAQAVCVNRGECDAAARAFVATSLAPIFSEAQASARSR